MPEVEMKRLVWLLSVLLLVPSVSGCGCTAELRVYRDPSTVTLAVAETAPPPRISTSGSGCFGPRQTVEILDWTSENPEIASVDPDTGVITGVAPGEAIIVGFAEENQREAYVVPVTVVAATAAAR